MRLARLAGYLSGCAAFVMAFLWLALSRRYVRRPHTMLRHSQRPFPSAANMASNPNFRSQTDVTISAAHV